MPQFCNTRRWRWGHSLICIQWGWFQAQVRELRTHCLPSSPKALGSSPHKPTLLPSPLSSASPASLNSLQEVLFTCPQPTAFHTTSPVFQAGKGHCWHHLHAGRKNSKKGSVSDVATCSGDQRRFVLTNQDVVKSLWGAHHPHWLVYP